MSDELPRRRTLESLKKEAKRWLDALRNESPAARQRLERIIADAGNAPTLRDVQLALARELGFPGWSDLKRHLETQEPLSTALRRYEEMAGALLEAYRTGTPAALERHWSLTWHRRSWQAMRTYVQLDLGRQVGSPGLEDDISLDDARYLVAREHGFERWDALVQHCAARPVAPERPALRELAAESHGRMTDALLAEIAELDDITELRLAGSRGVTDAGMQFIARMTQLTHLDLSGTSVTDAGVALLHRSERLRHVNLQWTATGDGALRALAGKPDLTHLRSGNSVTDAGLAVLTGFPGFAACRAGDAEMALTSDEAGPSYLLLRGPFTDRGMKQLVGLGGLFALNLDAAELGITPAGLEPLVDLPNLGWLAVNAIDASMEVIARMPKLRYLGCQDTVAGDDGFEALGNSRTIEYIWGRRCHNLRARGFRALGRIPTLRSLSVSCLNVDDSAVATLPGFPALRELMPMDIPDGGYRHIGKCERLESLVLMYCRDTGDAATEQITGLPALKKYFASYTRITDRTPELLSAMHTLENVTFDKCAGVTDAGIRSLARLPHLKELSVSGQRISADVAKGFPPGVRVHWFT
jgi:hypothetical protein